MWSVFSLTTYLCQQQTLLDFSSLYGTVCYTVFATWECLEHSACVIEYLVVLPCLKLSLIWHTKVKAKSDWSVKTYIKADHNTITLFGIKVMSKYKVLSKLAITEPKIQALGPCMHSLVNVGNYVFYSICLNKNQCIAICKFSWYK